MNKTTIDWPGLTHTFNPVSGCKRNCCKKTHGFDCYARELHTKRQKAVENGAKLPDRYKHSFKKIMYYPESLRGQVKKSRVVKKVFIGSMSDICYWDYACVEDITRFCKDRPEMEFMFLTKNPTVYIHHTFPENCWLGVTITGKEEPTEIYNRAMELFQKPENRVFVSFEPLLGDLSAFNFKWADLVIVGADTSKNPVIPKKEWIESIKHQNIHWKNNIRKYL